MILNSNQNKGYEPPQIISRAQSPSNLSIKDWNGHKQEGLDLSNALSKVKPNSRKIM